MSPEFEKAKAIFDADLADLDNSMTKDQIAEVVKSITVPAEQVAFIKYIIMRSAQISATEDDVDLDRVTEFFSALSDEPDSGKNLSRERFEELAAPLSHADKLYCAKMLIKQQLRNSERPSPISNPNVRTEAIKTYVRGLSAILRQHRAPTRTEFEQITAHLNDEEKAAIHTMQLESNGGKPLPFREDGPLH